MRKTIIKSDQVGTFFFFFEDKLGRNLARSNLQYCINEEKNGKNTKWWFTRSADNRFEFIVMVPLDESEIHRPRENGKVCMQITDCYGPLKDIKV